jgi:hypothetical protein
MTRQLAAAARRSAGRGTRDAEPTTTQPAATQPSRAASVGAKLGAALGNLLERHGEVPGELGVGAVSAGEERGRWEQALAGVAPGARREVAARLAGQLAGEHVAGVEHEQAHERLDRIAVPALRDLQREVEPLAAGVWLNHHLGQPTRAFAALAA